MTRREIVSEISHLLDNVCDKCPNKPGPGYIAVKSYCMTQCPTGLELRALGRKLESGRRCKQGGVLK